MKPRQATQALVRTAVLGVMMALFGVYSAVRISCDQSRLCTIEYLTKNTSEFLFSYRFEDVITLTLVSANLPTLTLSELHRISNLVAIKKSNIGRLILPTNCTITSLELANTHIGAMNVDWNEHILYLSSSHSDINPLFAALTNLTALSAIRIINDRVQVISFDLFRNARSLLYMELNNIQIDKLHFSEEHQCCQNLTDLSLSYNNLTAINLTLFNNFVSLERFSVAFNKIDRLLGTLTLDRLATLDFSGNRISSVDLCSWNVSSLTKLNLVQNRLEHMFGCLDRMPRLAYLELERNSITEIDFAIFSGSSIRYLDLMHNNISAVHNQHYISMFKYLKIGGNPASAMLNVSTNVET